MQRICNSLTLFLALNLVFAASLFGQGNSNNVRGLNGQVLQLQAAIHRSEAAAAAQIRADAAPLAEIAPDWRDPVTGRSVEELLRALNS